MTVQPGKVVVLLTGRYAGKKAAIVRNYDEGTSGRKYGHAVVCGLSKVQLARLQRQGCLQSAQCIRAAKCKVLTSWLQVIKRSSQKVQKRRASVKVQPEDMQQHQMHSLLQNA